jgi:hypothetical protein
MGSKDPLDRGFVRPIGIRAMAFTRWDPIDSESFRPHSAHGFMPTDGLDRRTDPMGIRPMGFADGDSRSISESFHAVNVWIHPIDRSIRTDSVRSKHSADGFHRCIHTTDFVPCALDGWIRTTDSIGGFVRLQSNRTDFVSICNRIERISFPFAIE